MKRQISNLVSIALLTVMAACGGGGGGGSPTPPPPPPPVDTTPNAFTFTGQSDTSPTAVVTSNEVTITGITAAAAVSITGGEYSIDGGAFTAAAGTVNNNQKILVRVTSSGQFSTAATATLTVGGVSAVFTSTTVAIDTTPNAFTFTSQSNLALATPITSSEITIAGINAPAAVSISGGEYSIDGGAFTATAGTVANNQKIRVRVTSSAQFSTEATATLTVGTVSAAFSTTTFAIDTTPNAFSFTSQADLTLSTAVTSNEITIAGINAPAAISITGGQYSIGGGAFTAAAGTVTNNQKILVRLNSSAQFSTAVTANLTVGGVSAGFTATTYPIDPTPDAFSFERGLNGTRGAWVVSASTTITGINTTVPVTIEDGEYSIGSGAYTSAAGTIVAGQALRLRVRASADYSKTTRTRVTVGGVAATFEVISELPNYIPDVVAYDGQDVVFLLNSANRLVFRWSIAEARYLDPYTVGSNGLAPTAMAYLASQHGLYLGYNSGSILKIDVTANTPVEAAFATMTGAISSLGSAGNFLAVQVGAYSYGGGYLVNGSGVTTGNGGYYYGYSRETAWDPITNRLYYTRDGISPNDLHYDVVDQTSGQVTSTSETPYHGAYLIQPPIRVSSDGQYVLLGSGDIYTQSLLNWSGSVGSQVADARWFANGSLVTLTTASNQTTLRRLSSNNLSVLEQLPFTGQALRVVGTDTRMAVLVINSSNTVQFYTYVPSDDSDNDGVENTQDAFPLDRAASVDTDRDGYPDSWNAGRSQTDSTTGLTLDAFPQDSACWLSAHGSGGVCNYGATMPNYTPDQVIQNGDVIYLLSSLNKRVYRWSVTAGAYLNPYIVGVSDGYSTLAPSKMAYSAAHQRLYFGYSSGAIRYIDTSGSNPAEIPFANTALGVDGLASVGNYVLAQDGSGAWATHYIFNSNGVVTDQQDWNYYSTEYAWDPTTSRVYFFRDNMSPDDLMYEVINQSTGEISLSGETPYHGSYAIQPPIRVSADGQYVLLGSGDIYIQPVLNWSGSLGAQITDARWLADGSIVTLTTSNNQTTLRRLGSGTHAVLEQLPFTGQALRVVGTDSRMTVLVINNGTVQFLNYVPDDDSDDDGVLNAVDAFPLDRAASVDTDQDGYPDAWNPGRPQADSTTGLTIDAFPNDSACWLSSHGVGGVCNNALTMPNYTPDKVAQQGDIIYLLSTANRRVYRWSISTGAYLNPYVVGINQGFSTLAPSTMEYSVSHQRLYLGYSSGAIRYIDVNAASSAEVAFATMPAAVTSLSSAGSFLTAQVSVGYDGGYILNSNGVVTGKGGYYYGYSRETAWDATNSRLYYFRDGISPNDLHYDVINQSSGTVTSTGETPYHGDYQVGGVIRVTGNGQTILLGTGDMYSQAELKWSGTLGSQLADARWLANGTLVTLTTANNQTLMRRLGAGTFATLEQLTYTGQALRVVGTDASMVILAINNGTVEFHNYVPNNDSDGDGVTNTADAFPLDVAASVDTDHDGFPDAWNAGRTVADSTTGLTLDAFPQNSACWLTAHGSGGVCNPGATVPNYTPDQVVQNGNVLYLLSAANRRVYRWSISAHAYLNPYIVGVNQGLSTIAPSRIEYSAAHQRLYVGYSTGAIRSLDVTTANPVETAFASPAANVTGLTSAGNYLVAHTGGTYGYGSTYVINASGVTTGTGTGYYNYSYSTNDYAWDAVTSRVYAVSDGYSSYALNYETIDLPTGTISSTGSSTYYSSSTPARPPVRVSVNGQYVLLGSGDIYAQSALTWAGSLGGQVADARWFANGTLAALTTANNQSVLRRLGATDLAVLEQKSYTGQALRVVGSDTLMVVLVVNNGALQFFDYVPNNDSDGDGVTNTADAFPLDAAASVDTDHDGYPNAWNAGKTAADSTTGLTLDAFPTEAACWLTSHGSGGICNFGATIPNYTPDKIDQQGDIIYLLSAANRRVYRWSMVTGAYLSPYVVGLNLGLSTAAPTTMTYSSAHNRLYLGYGTGAIRYLDVTANNPAETAFATLATNVISLASAGNFVAAQVSTGYNAEFILNSSGATTAQGNGYYYSTDSTWDPVTSRLYYSTNSSNALYYEVIDQLTGLISSTGNSAYYSNYSSQAPVRVSADGEQIVLGSGDIYGRTGLAHTGALGKSIKDAQWKGNLLVDVDTTDLVEIRNAKTHAVLQTYQYLGQPLRVLFGQTEGYLVHVFNGTTAFVRLAFYDQDGDQIARWWEQRYGLSDSNAADASADLDSDGVSNLNEFLNLSNPTVSDTDGDGLSDFLEIVTHHTNPSLTDTDGDGLTDYAEVITHHSDPLDTDSDNDTYSDLDEVLYGGNPNDQSVVPQPLFNYTQTFEGTPNLAAWTTPPESVAPWALDSAGPYAGIASFKSGLVGNSQNSSVRFRGFFRPGTLSFWAKVDPGYCCNHMYVLIDGNQQQYISGSTQWNNYSIQIPLGIHEVEWRFERDYYNGQASDAARIDDVVFVGQ